MSRHLFLCVPNNSGSSLMNRALGRCRLGIPLTGANGLQEGQRFFQPGQLGPRPEDLQCRRIWTEHEAAFADTANYRWDEIRSRWHAAWRRSKPDVYTNPRRVLIEKSPTNVVRANMLLEQFPGACFVVSLRNPYAVVEGIRRRQDYDLERCARHWLRCATLQENNLRALGKVVRTTYEELCARPGEVRERIASLLPELVDLDFASGAPVSQASASLSNFNARQVSRLSTEDRTTITRALSPHEALLRRWGYELLE